MQSLPLNTDNAAPTATTACSVEQRQQIVVVRIIAGATRRGRIQIRLVVVQVV